MAVTMGVEMPEQSGTERREQGRSVISPNIQVIPSTGETGSEPKGTKPSRKKDRKRWIFIVSCVLGFVATLAIALVVILNLGNDGRSRKTDVTRFMGTWYLSGGNARSLSRGVVADMWDYGLGSLIIIENGGTGTLTTAGKTYEFQYDVSADNELAATFENTNGTITLGSDGQLTLDGFADGSLYFDKNKSDVGRSHNGYVLDDSDTRVYSTDELEKLSDFELFLARNELYIRKGISVQSDQIQKRYDNLDLNVSEQDTLILNPAENTNITSIVRVEWSRNSMYLNMLPESRRDCYLSYKEELNKREDSDLILAQLVDFDGDDSTFEDLLAVYRNGTSYVVELLGYSEENVQVRYSAEVAQLSELVLEQCEDGYALKSDMPEVSWGDAKGELIGVTGYLIGGGSELSTYYRDDLVTLVDEEDIYTIAQETVETLDADYCNYGAFYGVWLPEVADVDDAWEQCICLQTLGYDAWKVQPKKWSGLDSEDDTYRVTAGRFSDEVEAREALESLERLGFDNLWLSYSGDYHDYA